VADVRTKANELAEVKKMLVDQNKEQTELKRALADQKKLILMLLQQVGSKSPEGLTVATASSSVYTPEDDDDETTKRGLYTLESSYPVVHTKVSDDNEVDD